MLLFIPLLLLSPLVPVFRGFSPGEWPVSGGVESQSADAGCSYQELVVTGHEDGSIRFWDASSTSMQSLYRYA